MTIINLGKNIDINLEKLLETRLLIQANSGGGKSFLLRKLLEESNGKVQQIVLDLEGEFSTLREKYDYLLVSKEGDVPITIKSASLLPKKILETEVSTIIDLSELKQHERILFVKRFLDTLMNLPKKYWKPLLVVVDESHVFAPQNGKCESSASVIDLCTRGRKRGFCACLASQRLSKLNKDAVAECNNKLIGRTGLDVDMKRASDELGFSSKSDTLSLRTLKAGEFFAFGSAISDFVIKVKIGNVKTTHPQPGGRIIKEIVASPAKIKKLAESFADLDIEAESELHNIEDFKREIKTLKQKLTLSKNADIEKEKQKAYDRGIIVGKKLVSVKREVVYSRSDEMIEKIKKVIGVVATKKMPKMKVQDSEFVKKSQKSAIKTQNYTFSEESNELARCPKKIYTFLFQNPHRLFTKSQIGFVTGYSHKSGGFSNAISELNSKGLIRKEGTMVGVGDSNPDLTLSENIELSIDLWLNKLGKCASTIFKELLDNPDKEYSKEELGEVTGYSYTSGGFSNAISSLNSNELLVRKNGYLKLHSDIKEMQEKK